MACETGRSTAPLFALIIGIDDYANFPRLGGAVADADAIKQYLKDTFQVSEDNIATLYNDKATRKGIIKAFNDLRDHQRIKRDDPIVIFYSGHGKELPAPTAWDPNGKIQSLLPHDFKVTDTASTPDHEPIPDRTIGALISQIAEAKGDNITVIFDCCFSGSGTRKEEDRDDEYVPRTIDLKFDLKIPETLDREIWGGRAGSIPNGFAYHGLQSHVLLSACRADELAYEYRGRGQFTAALLATLKSRAARDLTYAEVLGRIELQRQHPQCEGLNRNRVLFNAKLSSGSQVFHHVHKHTLHRGSKYTINAGLAHGVSRGAEFTLYDDKKQELDVVLVDETSSIRDFETTVTIPLLPARASSAKLTRVGKLPLYVDPRGNLSSALETLLRVKGHGTDAPNFRLVSEAEEAKLKAEMEGDRVVFKVLDERVRRFGLTELPYKAALNNVTHILGSAAHYYWFLSLGKGRDQISTQHEVAVDFYPLKIEYDDYGEPLLLPLEPGFCRKDSNNADVIDFVVDPEAFYGIKIMNNTPWDLYLNAFLFNNSSLSIVPHYTQSSAGNPEAPLKRGKIFTIGYGREGTVPMSYSLREDQEVDVGYLKIFFATLPIDMSDVAQKSPFLEMNAREGVDDDGSRGDRSGRLKTTVSSLLPFLEYRKPAHTWFTLDIPVVQRKKPVHAAV